MQEVIPLYVGYDPREAAAYHVFCQSVIERASMPVSFIPLHKPMLENFDGQKDGTNAFIYSRFLIPYLQGFKGWAIFCDGDMAMTDDIAKLWGQRDDYNKAVCVVKHDYKTKHKRKYIGTPMEADNVDYPRKNWSSVMLWNCSHYGNRILMPEFISESPGSLLHRFGWLKDEQVGDVSPDWNVLVGEQDASLASMLHFTLGIPAIPHYENCDGAEHWHRAKRNAMRA